MVCRLSPSLRSVDARASRQSRRIHAIRLGDRLHYRRSACRSHYAALGLEGIVRHWRVACVLNLLDPQACSGIRTMEIRRHEPSRNRVKIREMLSKNFRRLTILASSISTCVLFGYWGLFTWVPTFLASPTARGGAGLSMVQSSTWIVPMQVGAFFGYLSL